MQKYAVFFLTSIAAVWLINVLLTGIKISGNTTVFLIALLITAGVFLTDKLLEQMKKPNAFIYIIIGTLVNFFILYVGTLFFEKKFTATGGALAALNFGEVNTPTLRGIDEVLTLLLAALVAMIVIQITKWGMGGSKKSSS